MLIKKAADIPILRDHPEKPVPEPAEVSGGHGAGGRGGGSGGRGIARNGVALIGGACQCQN